MRKVCPADDGKSPYVTCPLEQFRVISTPSAAILLLPGKRTTIIHSNGNARVDKATEAFALDGLAPGPRLLRAQTPRGWMLKSVLVHGSESVDTPFELRPGQKLTSVSVVFIDKISEANGTVSDSQGAPVTEYTVLAFPDDASLWRPQARQIVTTRPDQNGTFQIRGLPAGQYYLGLVDPAEQGEWFDPAFLEQHRVAAQRLSLGERDVKTQDFKVSRRTTCRSIARCP